MHPLLPLRSVLVSMFLLKTPVNFPAASELFTSVPIQLKDFPAHVQRLSDSRLRVGWKKRASDWNFPHLLQDGAGFLRRFRMFSRNPLFHFLKGYHHFKKEDECVHTSFLSEVGLGPADRVMERGTLQWDVASQCRRQACKSTIAIQHPVSKQDTSFRVQNKTKKVPQQLLVSVKENFRKTWRIYKSLLN